MDDYGQSVSRCPSCGGTILTPAEAAAHVCPTALTADPTTEQVADAALATRLKTAQRAALLPTREALMADARKCVQAIVDGWDREVEAIVILGPKGTLDKVAVVRFLDGDHRQRQKQILNHVLSKSGSYRRMNGS
jgi:hypothetical protein